jgi:hypothetical protein
VPSCLPFGFYLYRPEGQSGRFLFWARFSGNGSKTAELIVCQNKAWRSPKPVPATQRMESSRPVWKEIKTQWKDKVETVKIIKQ